eukprot:5202417-Pyramimonas_sp.AAC.1
MIWKFHGVLHHAQTVQALGWSPHTITLERKHKFVLKYGEDQQADTSKIVREIVAKSLHDWNEAKWLDLSIGLKSPERTNKKRIAALVEHFGP